jgi:hypothetical protein
MIPPITGQQQASVSVDENSSTTPRQLPPTPTAGGQTPKRSESVQNVPAGYKSSDAQRPREPKPDGGDTPKKEKPATDKPATDKPDPTSADAVKKTKSGSNVAKKKVETPRDSTA